jgi:hypothetical protein
MPSVVIGTDTETGEEVRIGDSERRSGLLVFGRPRTGKTALLVNLMLQDIQNGHGLFFLDPYGDAITELLNRGEESRLLHDLRLLDPTDPALSFGINLLACRDLTSLRERTAAYERAYRVFEHLWGDTWGQWSQLIVGNTLSVFLENPEYTLAEVPLFLTNADFRNHLVNNVTYNPDAADFWRYEFGARPKREQLEQIQAALTRVRTLFGHPHVRHIIGQRKTTIDLTKVMEERRIVLVRLPARLAPDIKKFIGTILMSELLQAIRNRPEGKGGQFCIFLEEFQDFIATEDVTTLLVQADSPRDIVSRIFGFEKNPDFGIALTLSHAERSSQLAENPMVTFSELFETLFGEFSGGQETEEGEGQDFGIDEAIAHEQRSGQFTDKQKLLGTTAAPMNKIVFQVTAQDAEVLAPEFVQSPEVGGTQADLIDEMAVELANLPHRIAYAELIQERGGEQVVVRRKIRT